MQPDGPGDAPAPRFAETRLRSLFDANPDPMLELDVEAALVRLNAAAAALLGAPPEGPLGLTLAAIVVEADRAAVLEAFERARAGQGGSADARVRHADEAVPVSITFVPIEAEAGRVYVHIHDLRTQLSHQRELAAHAERLQQIAYTDPVTTLPNRAWLVERLRTELASAAANERQVGVLFLDLDRFKDINDTLGHESGDRLLRIVGERLVHAIRSGDVVARMGGDEFVVLAIGPSDTPSLAGLATRIIEAVEAPISLAGSEQFVTASIGIASFPEDGGDAETLVKHADVAMYRAKDRGRNTFQFFTPALNATLQRRLSQEKALRKALEDGAFVVHYQPQHDLADGRLVAVEALVRWNHPRAGLTLPAHFLPAAETSGLIVALDDFVLATACADLARWRAELAPDLRVTVNLSARQFHHAKLIEKIREAIDANAVDPGALELEISESVAMGDANRTVGIMRELGAAGLRWAIDDFGTGFSSLGFLHRFPLDALKIDRSFITDFAQEPDAGTVVRAILAMAHALGLEVVAEGVQDRAQFAFLKTERCDRVQGYYFSPALSAAALEAYIGRRGVATG